MFDERVLSSSQFPILEKNRKSTDVICTIIGAILAIGMFVLACCMWNQDNFNKLSSLSDSNGNTCQKYLHYPNPKDFSKKQCVESCPSGYKSFNSAAGGACLPSDQSARDKLMSDPSFSGPFDRYSFRRALFWCALIALGVGFLYMSITHCLPKYAPMLAFGLAIAALIAIGVLLLILDGGFWRGMNVLKIIVIAVCFVLALLLFLMLCMYSSEVKFQGLMLDYAVRFFKESGCTFSYILVYLLFTVGLIVLICWQQACFSSWFNQSLSFGPWSSGVWGVLNILEFIWGLQFLRDSFNFCVSGNAVDWYWTGRTNCYSSYQRLVCKHWGSVVGGSFLNAFFQVPTLLVELLICHPQTCCAKLGTICYNKCNFCTCFFDLVRTDAYSYINLSGIPYCDAAQQCRKICDRSHHFIGTHSAMKHYRFVAHVAVVSLAFIACFFVLRHRVWNFTGWQLAILLVLIYAITTWFVNIHADAAEGIQTSFLVEHELENNYDYMHRILPSYRKELAFLDGRQVMDGNC